MAKSKFKLDSKTIQAWLNMHAEKLGLGFCGIMFLWMAYSSYGLSPYKKKPAELVAATTNAQNKINNSGDKEFWDKKADGIVVPDPPYADQVNVALKELDPKPYAWTYAYNRPLFEDRSRRGEPVYLPPLELRAAYHQGAISQGENATGPLGHTWIVLTALVPLMEQTAEYDKQLKASILYRPDVDKPAYANFVVERVEIVNGQPQPPVTLNLDDAYTKNVDLFSPNRTEIIDPRELENFGDPQAILNSIPPLIEPAPDQRYWHEPQIKKAAGGPVKAAVVEGPAPKQRPGALANRANKEAAKAPEPQANQAAEKPVELRLFRFCDFTAERHKTYRYRVKFVLLNPNFELDPISLKTPKLAQGETRESTWSEPSNDIQIPGHFQIALVDVRPAQAGQEALAKFTTIRFAEKYGVVAGYTHGEFPPNKANVRTFERGTRVNFPSQATKVRKAGTAELIDGIVDFTFNGVLLGMSGGNETRRGNVNLKVPGEAIFFWPDGRLEMRSQVSDGPMVYALENPTKPEGVVAPAEGGEPQKPNTPAPPPKNDKKDTPKSKLEDFLKTPPKAAEKK